jgi:hypothetical protein
MTKKNTTKSHLKSRLVPNVKVPLGGNPPVCWSKPSPNASPRILFVAETRDKKYAVYYVDEIWQTDTGQKKRPFLLLPVEELRGFMQIKLDEYAREEGLKRCPAKTWVSIQEALKIGGAP